MSRKWILCMVLLMSWVTAACSREFVPTPTPQMTHLSAEPPRRSQFLDALLFGQSEDCQFPCWHGLRPEETTLSDIFINDMFQNYLYEGTDARCKEGRDTSADELFIQCYWDQLPFGMSSYPASASFFFDPQTETLITIWVHAPGEYGYYDAPLTFEDVITEFGSPEYQRTLIPLNPRGSTCACSMAPSEFASGRYAFFDMLYTQQGIIVSSGSQPAEYWPCLCQQMTVQTITIEQSMPQDATLKEWYDHTFFDFETPEESEFVLFGPFGGLGIFESDE